MATDQIFPFVSILPSHPVIPKRIISISAPTRFILPSSTSAEFIPSWGVAAPSEEVEGFPFFFDLEKGNTPLSARSEGVRRKGKENLEDSESGRLSSADAKGKKQTIIDLFSSPPFPVFRPRRNTSLSYQMMPPPNIPSRRSNATRPQPTSSRSTPLARTKQVLASSDIEPETGPEDAASMDEDDLQSELRDLVRVQKKVMSRGIVNGNGNGRGSSSSSRSKIGSSTRSSRPRRILGGDEDIMDVDQDDSHGGGGGRGDDSGNLGDNDDVEFEEEGEDIEMESGEDEINRRRRYGRNGSVESPREGNRVKRRGTTEEVARAGRLSALEQLKLSRQKSKLSKLDSPAVKCNSGRSNPKPNSTSSVKPRSNSSIRNANTGGRTDSLRVAEQDRRDLDRMFGSDDEEQDQGNDGGGMMMVMDSDQEEELAAINMAENPEAAANARMNGSARTTRVKHPKRKFQGSGKEGTRSIYFARPIEEEERGSVVWAREEDSEEEQDESIPLPWSMTPPKSDESNPKNRQPNITAKQSKKRSVEEGISWEPTSEVEQRKGLEDMFDDDGMPDGEVEAETSRSGGGSGRRSDVFYSAAEDHSGRNRTSSKPKGEGKANLQVEAPKSPQEEYIDLEEAEDDDDGFILEPTGTQDAGAYDDVNLADGYADVITLDDDDDEEEEDFWGQDGGDDFEFDEAILNGGQSGSGSSNNNHHNQQASSSNSAGAAVRHSGQYAVPAVPARFRQAEPERFDEGPIIHPLKSIDSLPPHIQDFYLNHWRRGAVNTGGQTGAERQEEQARVKEREQVAGRGGRSGGARGGGGKTWRGKASWRGGGGGGRGGWKPRGRGRK